MVLHYPRAQQELGRRRLFFKESWKVYPHPLAQSHFLSFLSLSPAPRFPLTNKWQPGRLSLREDCRPYGILTYTRSTFERAVPAARSLVKLLRQNQTVIVIADGSRGPRHRAQPGSIQLASITGVPVIPMTFDAKYRIELDSWDRFIIPLPFTRCTLNFGKPIHVPRHASEDMIS